MKRVLNRTLSMALMAGLVGAPVMTALAEAPPETQASPTQPAAGGLQSLSKQDLKELADYGASRGEDVSDLRAYANGEQRSAAAADKGRFPPIGLFDLQKKVLGLLVERGGPALEKALSKFSEAGKLVKQYRGKVVEALKKLKKPDESAIRKALISAGIPEVAAKKIAPWIDHML